MSTDRAIFAALDTRLAAFVPAMPTAWPNVNFNPTKGTAWLKVDHLPAQPVRRSIGVNGQNAYPGVFQVMVNWPPGVGAGDAQTRADAIANHFPLGAVYGGVRVAAVRCGPPLSDAEWFSIPVSITYELVTTS